MYSPDKLNKLSDSELTVLLKQGDVRAYTEIFDRYWEKLLSIAYLHTRDKSDAQEIVQEVMVRLWDKRAVIQIRSLNNYLAVAVRLSVFKSIHQRNRRSEILDNLSPDPSYVKLDEELDALFLEEYLSGAVGRLPEKCRLVFVNSRYEHKRNPEIAEELNISEKTVEAHLTRAIKLLRSNLKKAGILMLSLLHVLLQGIS